MADFSDVLAAPSHGLLCLALEMNGYSLRIPDSELGSLASNPAARSVRIYRDEAAAETVIELMPENSKVLEGWPGS